MDNAETAFEQMAADIHAVKKGLQIAAVAAYSGSLMAARIQSAKTDYERNKAISEAAKLLESMKKSLEEPECQTAKTS